MVIDVLINSCARPDILDVSINTFLYRILSSHDARFIIIEDKVEDEERQVKGREYIESRNDLFDKIVYLDKKAGPGFFFAPAVAECKSDFFFHLEDDNEFIQDIYIDPIISLMEKNEDVVEVMMSRGSINPINNPRKTTIDGVKVTEFDLFSVATGLFNTNSVRKMLDKIGWDKQLHEAGTLTPMSKKLGLRKFILGHDEQHYVHVGAEKGYRKGGWRK